MNSFPLYSNIKNQVQNKGLIITKKIKEQFKKDFKKVDTDSHELIYALIRAYQLDKNINIDNLLAFKARKLKYGVKYNLDELPEELINILIFFIKMDLNKNN